jgi:hypothetical protein
VAFLEDLKESIEEQAYVCQTTISILLWLVVDGLDFAVQVL